MGVRIYVGGTFDLFHYGHLRLFREIKKRFPDSVLIVALNTDDFCKRYSGQNPVLSFIERAEMLLECKLVDAVTGNLDGEDSKPCILRMKPDYIVHGDDWTGESLMKQMGLTQEWLDEHGIKMLYLPYTKGISSTEIKDRIIDQYIAEKWDEENHK